MFAEQLSSQRKYFFRHSPCIPFISSRDSSERDFDKRAVGVPSGLLCETVPAVTKMYVNAKVLLRALTHLSFETKWKSRAKEASPTRWRQFIPLSKIIIKRCEMCEF